MEYQDQYILELRRKKVFNNFENVRYESFFNGLVEIPLSKDFVDMPDELCQKMFIAEELPVYIRTVNNGEITMSLGILDSSEQIEKVLARSKELIRQLYPENVIYEEGKVCEMGGWFDCKSFEKNATYYNVYFIVEKDGIKVFGSFRCNFKIYDKWKTQIFNILNQIR